SIAPVLRPLAMLGAPIGGSIGLALDTTNAHLESARLNLKLGAGTLTHPLFSHGAIPIASGQLRATYDTPASPLTLHELTVDLGGPVATVSGTVDGLDTASITELATTGAWTHPLQVAAEADVRRMPTNDLERYWPLGLGTNARNWVTGKIHDGGVDEAQLTTRLRFDPAQTAPVQLDVFTGSMKMHGLTVDYHRPLPAVRGVDGTATFDQKKMTLLPTSGTLKGQKVTGGTIVITDLDVVDQWIDINLDVVGPVRDALEVIDAKPLEYAKRVGLDPSRVEGMANAHLRFYFMLDRRTTMDQVEFGVMAQLTGVVLRKVAFDQDLSDGNLKLKLDRGQLQLDGDA